MDKILTGKAMKKVDSYTIEKIGIPSMVLMERAAYSMFLFMQEKLSKCHRILCVCGTGNNGADGIALSRHLTCAGYSVDILIVGNEGKATEEFATQRQIAVMHNINIMSYVTEDDKDAYNKVYKNILKDYDCVVDAIFGVGLTRDIEGIYAEVINDINRAVSQRNNEGRELFVISTDIPSGLDSDNGQIRGCAIKANYTVTFGRMKSGLLLYKGKDMAGEIVVTDVGFPAKAYEKVLSEREDFSAITDGDVFKAVKRDIYSNKGTYGKVLVVAGSKDMYGAAYLSARAAFETGCGLVKIITHENNRDLLYKMIPEAIIETYDEKAPDVTTIENAIKWCDTVVIGPGIGKSYVAAEILKSVMVKAKALDKYIVIDADGLNIIASDLSLTELYHKKVVITPHVGEASRLMGKTVSDIAADIVNKAYEYSDTYGINVVIKDATTVILGIESLDNKCNNRVCINTSGNAGMATAGSGDVLTGVIAAVLSGGLGVGAENLNTLKTIALGVYIHGKAGDIAADLKGQTSMVASDIVDKIINVLRK